MAKKPKKDKKQTGSFELMETPESWKEDPPFLVNLQRMPTTKKEYFSIETEDL